MLGTRTKQVNSYGRRGHRIVNVTNDHPYQEETQHAPSYSAMNTVTSPPKKRYPSTRVILSPSPSPRTHRVQKKSPAFKRLKKSLTYEKQEDPKGVSSLHKHLTAAQNKLPIRPVSKASLAGDALSIRKPLGYLPFNLPVSPAAPAQLKKKPKAPIGKGMPLKPSSPIVHVDIVVFDNFGRRISQERRVPKSDVQVNPMQQMSKKSHSDVRPGASSTNAIILTDSEDDVPVVRRAKLRTKAPVVPMVISSEDSDSGVENVKPSPVSTQPTTPDLPRRPARVPGSVRRNVIVSPPTSPDTPPMKEARPIPPGAAQRTAAPYQTLHLLSEKPIPLQHTAIPPYLNTALPRSKPRQLTPIRNRIRRSAAFPAPPSPPSPTTPTDFDDSLDLDLEDLALSPSTRAQFELLEKPQPGYLRSLLQECSQTTPHEFSAFIDMFPFDPIVQSVHDDGDNEGLARFQKIGEASFSEVFGIGDVVLKVIPLRNEEAVPLEYEEECPSPSDARDVLNEVIVTRAMGETCEGFVKLLRTYIVRGKYPSLLLDLWDEYHERKGSESIRPDGFSVSQVYAIIVLPNGGPDLEAYSFSPSPQTRWRRACSIFWQVARALAEAEDLVRFEHRDLHWGQILVKTIPTSSQSKRPRGKRAPMDHDSHGVKVTVIDLGLARMDADDGTKEEVRWTPFEPEIFEGEGDYQFDVYRMMKTHNDNQWHTFRPLTNVMWLHYLTTKLLHAKHLRAPTASRKSTAAAGSATFSEMQCYQCLGELENTLSTAVASSKSQAAGRKGRRKTQAIGKVTALAEPQSARDVLRLGTDHGWIS